jgi:hypothetical protein
VGVHRLLPARPASLLLLLALLALACGCGRNGGGDRSDGDPGTAADAPPGEVPAYPGEPSLEPADVARAYVEALDKRDGRRFCGLVAPYIAGRYDLALQDPDSGLGRIDGCPEFVSGFIGYIEDCCPPEFKGASVARIDGVEERGELRMVRARVRLKLVENDVPRTETVDEVVWVARLEGAWRVVKLGEVARAASLQTPRFSDESHPPADDDPEAEPDLAWEQRAFAALVDRAERRATEREASYGSLGDAADCSGGVSVKDAEGDQDWNGGPSASGEVPRVPAADLLGVEVVVKGRDVCVRWKLAGTPTSATSLTYIHRVGQSGSFLQGFDVEIRGDRTARVTSGQDDEGRPFAAPAEVGADDRSVTVVLNAESFRAGQANWTTKMDPPLERFGFSASGTGKAGASNSVRDVLASDPAQTFRYPDGRPCEPQC